MSFHDLKRSRKPRYRTFGPTDPVTIEEKLQERLRKAGLSSKIVEVVKDEGTTTMVKLSCPDYSDWLLSRKELSRIGVNSERV